MAHYGLLLYSQKSLTGPYSESDNSILKMNLILFYLPSLGVDFLSELFPKYRKHFHVLRLSHAL